MGKDQSIYRCAVLDLEEFDCGEIAALDSFGLKIEIENGLVTLHSKDEDDLRYWMEKFGKKDFDMFYSC